MIWYIAKDGEAKRIPEEVLKYKIENDEISGDTLAVNEEIGNWVPLKETTFWAEYHEENSGTPPCPNIADKSHQQEKKPQNIVQGHAVKINWVALGVVVLVVVAYFVGGNLWSPKLNGTYMTNAPLAYNAITFSADGTYYRESMTFDSWEKVASGTYELQGSELVLNYENGGSWTFYYDKDADTMCQQGTSLVYVRVQ